MAAERRNPLKRSRFRGEVRFRPAVGGQIGRKRKAAQVHPRRPEGCSKANVQCPLHSTCLLPGKISSTQDQGRVYLNFRSDPYAALQDVSTCDSRGCQPRTNVYGLCGQRDTHKVPATVEAEQQPICAVTYHIPLLKAGTYLNSRFKVHAMHASSQRPPVVVDLVYDATGGSVRFTRGCDGSRVGESCRDAIVQLSATWVDCRVFSGLTVVLNPCRVRHRGPEAQEARHGTARDRNVSSRIASAGRRYKPARHWRKPDSEVGGWPMLRLLPATACLSHRAISRVRSALPSREMLRRWVSVLDAWREPASRRFR